MKLKVLPISSFQIVDIIVFNYSTHFYLTAEVFSFLLLNKQFNRKLTHSYAHALHKLYNEHDLNPPHLAQNSFNTPTKPTATRTSCTRYNKKTKFLEHRC